MNLIKYQLIQFIIMFIVGIFFNPMNILSYNINHFYISLTLVYGGLLMASNMIWTHEIVHYLYKKHFNIYLFLFGISLSFIISIFLLRKQLFISDDQWLKRMISHHSTALTTSNKIIKKSNNNNIKKLANDIIITQENEIKIMKSLLNNK